MSTNTVPVIVMMGRPKKLPYLAKQILIDKEKLLKIYGRRDAHQS